MNLFNRKQWVTPGGSASNLYIDMLKQPHILIAGATGSGKSVLINGLIYTALYNNPNHVEFALIDPKRVELYQYAKLPHTTAYASEPQEIITVLNNVVSLLERRFQAMRRRGERKSSDSDVYVFIDEFADLMTTNKREALPLLCRIAQLGRAANIHLILATQRPTRDILNGQIKVNIDARIALRCPTAQDSRNIINQNGAETLARYGQGYYLTPETMQPVLVDIPYIDDSELADRVCWWLKQN